MSGAKSIILDLAREDSLPWLFFWLAVLKMFVCIAVPFRLNHVIVAGDGNEQVGIKLSDNLTGHLMLGRDGLQIFIICFQAIHIDNLIPTMYKLILQRVWHMIIIIWNGASLLVNCLKHLPVGKFSFIVQFLDIPVLGYRSPNLYRGG